jgi:uncharacterized protein (DUF983 family)
MQITFSGLLFILFLGLKLAGFITWSWIWVTAPLWIPLAIAMFMMSIVGVIACVSLKDKGYNAKKT